MIYEIKQMAGYNVEEPIHKPEGIKARAKEYSTSSELIFLISFSERKS